MRISIAMATYNGARYLQEQLVSFLCQTRQPDELVVCDDGSTDDTLKILESFRKNAPFAVHVYRNETNLGYIKNFEKALSLCTGDIIFLSDQDDVWFDSKIERISLEFILHETTWVVVNDAELVHADLKSTRLTIAGQLVSAGIGVDQLHHGCCIALRSEFKQIVLPIPCKIYSHDGWINALGNALHRRHFVSDVLQFYRRHGLNTSASSTSSTRVATQWRLLREKMKWSNIKRDPRAASAVRLEQINAIKGRLKMHEAYLQQVLPNGISAAQVFSRLDQERSANESRRSLQQLPFISRLIESSKFYLVGGYRQFDGLKSLVRDIIR